MRLRFLGTLLFCLAISLPAALAQTILIDEELRDGSLPLAWSQNDVSFTTAADGYAHLQSLSSTLTTPIIDLSGYINVSLQFDVAKYGSGNNGPITVEISNDGGSTWTAQTFDSPVPTSSSYMTSGPTAISVTGPNVRIRFTRASSDSAKRLRDVILQGEGGAPVCSNPSQISFTGFPALIAQDNVFPIELSLLCANDMLSDCNNGSVTLTSTACGLTGSLTQPVVNGIAYFDDLSIGRSLQPGIQFTAVYTGSCGSFTSTSVLVDVEAPPLIAGGPKIAFVKINSDDTDEFSFVALSDIANGQEIHFSDNGWYASGGFRDNEGTVLWTANSDIACGTIITISGTNSANIGSVVHSNPSFALTTSGDQILAFTGTEENPSFIAGINIDSSCWGDATSSNTSALPAPLVEGVNAVCLEETDNSILTFSPSGDPDEVMAQINTAANWTNSNNRINNPYNGTITVNCSSGEPSLLPTADAGLDFTGCNGGPNELSVGISDAIGQVSYEWSPAMHIDGPTDGPTAQAINSTTTTFTITISDEDGCLSSDEVTLNIPSGPAGEWTNDYGNNDWFECLNWANGKVPDSNTDVSIPSVTSDPEIADEPFHAFCKDLNLGSGRSLIIDGDPELSLEVHGDISGSGNLQVAVGELIFAGSSDQTIAASTNILSYKLKINKPLGSRIFANNAIDISNEVQFNSGIIEMLNGSSLNFALNATATAASNDSYVDGKVSKTANSSTNFSFPIGDSNADGDFYQAARIFGLSGGTSTFEAQYTLEEHPFAGAYYDGESNSPNDNQEIGNCDYWTLNKTSGTGDIKLALTFTNENALYCNVVNDPTFLRIASLNPSLEWDQLDTGNSPNEIAMNTTIGTVPTGGTYGDFALYSTGGHLINILPIELLSFTVSAQENSVLSKWTTSTETNNHYFTLERSADAQSFSPIGTVEGAGNSQQAMHYSFIDDAPLPGLSYYRLRQTDYDGMYSYSEIRSVSFTGETDFQILQSYRSENQLHLLYSASSSNITLEVYDLLGKRLHSERLENFGSRAILNLNLSRGTYILRISNHGHSHSQKFFW